MNSVNFWQALADAIWTTINKNSPPSNVLRGFNILGGYMKEEVLAQYKQGQETLLSDLYDAAYADGEAGKEATGITQEQLDAAKAESFEAGKASVVIPEGGTYSDEQYKALESELATAKEELATAKLEDAKTPHTAEELAEVTAKLETVEAKLAEVTSDDEADKAAIAEGQAIIAAVKAALEPKVLV